MGSPTIQYSILGVVIAALTLWHTVVVNPALNELKELKQVVADNQKQIIQAKARLEYKCRNDAR